MTAGARIPNVLSIAGSDPSGGAGIQADLKTFAAHDVYGMAVITALTAQNTRGVLAVSPVRAAFVTTQIEAIFADIRVDAVKIGMLATAAIARAVAEALERHRPPAVVLDPVMLSTSGRRLLSSGAARILCARLAPLADVVTPNLPEAHALLGARPGASRAEMPDLARRLRDSGMRAVLLKGGHLGGPDSPDYLLDADGGHWLEARRIQAGEHHGTGCTLSSALAANLARGKSLEVATRDAKDYLFRSIGAARRLDVGRGNAPLHHNPRGLR